MAKAGEKSGAADAPLELNAAQRKAVEHGGAPLLVVAGAATVSTLPMPTPRPNVAAMPTIE